eukprot:1161545-Pelagomonas_calceolata.AAC.10
MHTLTHFLQAGFADSSVRLYDLTGQQEQQRQQRRQARVARLKRSGGVMGCGCGLGGVDPCVGVLLLAFSNPHGKIDQEGAMAPGGTWGSGQQGAGQVHIDPVGGSV